ncbi:HET-domain-containing protein [Xylariaceae sp. FL0662B]|nr:HET-domain-containing protein [Xylariaceae sp. FL0662B]
MWCLNDGWFRRKWSWLLNKCRHSGRPRTDVDLRPQKFSYSSVPLYNHEHIDESFEECKLGVARPFRVIRLLRILPTRLDGRLECHIRTVDLNSAEAPSYDALSYTWGPTTRTEMKNGMNAKPRRIILCDGAQLSVTENLYNCLTQLQESSQYDRDLWVDAICVDQDDHNERCQQVSIMADIYRSAQRVIVWLGAADEFTQPACELITRLSRLSERDLHTIEPQEFENPHNDELLGKANSPKHWKSLALLFGRTWFTRSWVIQELVLAHCTVVLCGNYAIRWEDMVDVSHFLATRTSANTFKTQLFDGLDLTSLSYKNPAKLAAVKEHTLKGTSDILLHSLVRCRTYEASREHDKVYSLLGLAIPEGCEYRKYLYPDYECNVAKLYTDVTKYILETSNDLHVLAHAEGDDFKHTPGLPSWVPDWSTRKDLGLRITGYARYEAAGKLPCVKNVQDGNVLVLRGAELDTISRVGESKAEVNRNKTCASWLSILEELEQEYPEREYQDALWRTLLIDTDPSGTVPIKQPWENAFNVWMGLCTHEPTKDEKQRAAEFETSFTHSLNLRLFRTTRGHLGVGSQSCKEGDFIYIVQGSRVPLMLRPTQKGSTTYRLAGGAYLHGFMQGEALDGLEFKDVVLI